MSTSVQKRGARFQLRVTHKLLPKPFFFSFASEVEARTYGGQLQQVLAKGVVPIELLEKPRAEPSPLLVQVVRSYTQESAQLTPSDDALLTTMLGELVGQRVSDISYAWADSYVRRLKIKNNMAPGTIRKRIGALARVIDWHLATTKSTEANALRALPVGYSQYNEGDIKAGAKVKEDVQRDRRLSAGEEARIRPHLGRLELMFDVIVNAGLRLREAYKLRVDQVDLERGLLNVEGSKVARGRRKPRVVPVGSTLREALRAHCKGRVGLLWPYWDGTPKGLKTASTYLSAAFKDAFVSAGIDDLTEHDLRHEATCRWFLMRNGTGWTWNEVEVCRIMGWTDTKMALRYASLRGEDMSARMG